jgi:hypothetical protein
MDIHPSIDLEDSLKLLTLIKLSTNLNYRA